MRWFFRISFLLTLSLLVTSIAMASGGGEEHESFEAPLATIQAPFGCGESFRVSQGHRGKTHQGWGEYAWDFSTPEGTLLTSPVDGVVRMVRDDSTRYGCDPSYGWDANYVVIQFDDDLEVLLLHLQADSALVKPGDVVHVGDPLARVGNSGWVCGTHLHLQVQQSCNNWWCPSVPAAFEDSFNPQRGDHLQAQVCPLSPEEEMKSASNGSAPNAAPSSRPSPWRRFLSLIFPRPSPS